LISLSVRPGNLPAISDHLKQTKGKENLENVLLEVKLTKELNIYVHEPNKEKKNTFSPEKVLLSKSNN
jgi:hypothetical protein